MIAPDTQYTEDSAVTNLECTIDRIQTLAIKGLAMMFDQSQQLFCYRLKKTNRDVVREGLSRRYTMMTLLGLDRLEQAGGDSRFDKSTIFATLLSDLKWLDNIGDLGVLLWLSAKVFPERLSELEARLNPEEALLSYQDARRGATMELAWFLTGLSYWAQSSRDKLPHLETLAFKTYGILTKNQGTHGFFGHMATSASVAGMVRGRTGTFADQVYPIYALTQFAAAYQHEEAAERALKCALALCQVQGPLGQWWWHYDAKRGRVVEGYPVFSVHQHAMGPMALFALGDLLQRDFTSWIYDGLDWIDSKNELSVNMEDASCGVIWRCIFRTRRPFGKYLQAAFGYYADAVQNEDPESLSILFECRPYELGWLLYAFANRSRNSGAVQAMPRAQVQVQ